MLKIFFDKNHFLLFSLSFFLFFIYFSFFSFERETDATLNMVIYVIINVVMLKIFSDKKYFLFFLFFFFFFYRKTDTTSNIIIYIIVNVENIFGLKLFSFSSLSLFLFLTKKLIQFKHSYICHH